MSAAARVGSGIMAAALVKASLVDEGAARKAGVLADVRAWLTQVASGATVKVREMSADLTSDERGYVAARLRAAGFLHTVVQGGARAGGRLHEVALAAVSDDQIAALVWGAPRTPAEAPLLGVGEAPQRPEAPVATAGRWGAAPPLPDFGPVPRSKAAQDAALIKHVRAWLARVAAGEVVPIGHLSNVCSTPTRSQHGGRLCAAGLVSREGGVYSATGLTGEAAAGWSDEQLAAVLWPGRVGHAAEGQGLPEGMAPEDDAAVLGALAAPEATGDDPLARVLGQVLDVLVRLDARMARLERAWDIPPLEGEAP